MLEHVSLMFASIEALHILSSRWFAFSSAFSATDSYLPKARHHLPSGTPLSSFFGTSLFRHSQRTWRLYPPIPPPPPAPRPHHSNSSLSLVEGSHPPSSELWYRIDSKRIVEDPRLTPDLHGKTRDPISGHLPARHVS